MKLTRLRLVGFKSFVDAMELDVQPGLTGVVGPNGCGKSNLVEALRWAMGEGSHKALRASAMEDVIFAGSGQRPARNTAEVTISLDNAGNVIPQYAGVDELEITRRIEREKGSVYRVNGREVRARDVQLLFADASTGARSPALVRQGQIGEIINAKPEARRRVLEEAAGIAGLHARRHESELKLRAAEQNLERVEDVLQRMRSQLDALKRQARQAVKYRQLSGDIRRLESLQLARAHAEAEAERDASRTALIEAERIVAERTLAQNEAAKNDAVAGHELPELRNAAAASGAALERLKRAGEDLDREERQAREKIADLERRIAQLENDRAREEALAKDAVETLERFKSELAALEAEDAGTEDAQAAAAARVTDTDAALKDAETALAEASAALAARTAERDALTRTRTDAASRVARLTNDLQRLENEARQLDASAPPRQLADLAADAEAAGAALKNAEGEAAAAETALAQAREAASRARQAQREAETELNRLQVEASTLARMLDVDSKHKWQPVVDDVHVARGFESAIAAALGEDLSAPLDTSAPVHWGEVDAGSDDPALPEGVESLITHIEAPHALRRRLSQIGVVAREDGPRLQKHLKSGQRLVSREGDLWRWDGFTAMADAQTASARRLEGRNRLKEIETALIAAFETVKTRKIANAEQEQAVAAATQDEQAKRNAVRTARAALEKARESAAEAERAAAHLTARRNAISEQLQRVTADEAEAKAALASAEEAVAALLPVADLETKRDELRAGAERARTASADARATAGTITREREARQRQRENIVRERANWEQRQSGASTRVADIEERRVAAAAEFESLQGVPEEVAAKRRSLLSSIGEAETAAKAAADRLAEGESKKSAAENAARDALRALGESREVLAREETRREAADARLADVLARYVESFGAPPDTEARAAAADGAPSEEMAADLERMKAERDRLGAVNLRAEEEMTEVQTAHDSLVTERDDLVEAIKSLRTGIQSLNREGRERLTEAFDAVNTHFTRLFSTLFGGGEAQLELVEADDPLEAGLEIIARPPGKKPQTLSLLSGGEQALTAMALIFAIFLTNPAPLCVLDEVDAPLDDANVDRFCDLLDAMRKETDTRFLVVTHNPVTMSRMDRLFGVTMAERGVSQLVSVDLEAAERLREAV